VLLLTAIESYKAEDVHDKFSHITNTFQQQDHPSFVEEECVLLLEDMETILKQQGVADPGTVTSKMMDDIGGIMSEVFDAYRGEFSVFQPLPNCFEVFGVDFLVDEDYHVWLLEVNPGPDFKQTGKRLHYVIQDLVSGMVDIATDKFFGLANAASENYPGFNKVYDDAWGFRSKEPASMKFHDDEE